MRDMEIGAFVADAHDGVEVKGWKATSIQINCEGSTAIMRKVMEQAGLQPHTYVNKYVVIVDSSYDGSYRGVYSYDDMYLGFVHYTKEE